MLTTRLGNIIPHRVLLRKQNSSEIVRATPEQIALLSNVMVSRDPVDGTWVSVSSDKSEEFGTILVQCDG